MAKYKSFFRYECEINKYDNFIVFMKIVILVGE